MAARFTTRTFPFRKRCFKCGEEKPRSEFYGHPRMADGLLGKCKACTKTDVSRRYRLEKPARQVFDVARNRTAARKAERAAARKRHRDLNPEKYRARTAVGNALRDGKIEKAPCETCGAGRAQAHHEDYSKPLEIRWLCFACHRREHGQEID
jgi:hypothetical protein